MMLPMSFTNDVKTSPSVDKAIPRNISHYYNLEQTSYVHETTMSSNQPKFMCTTCNKSFFSNGRYQMHLEEHVECPFPECKLVACMKIIDQHISHQHMMVNFESLQVDDDKWIEDRKKRFPTTQRAEQRRLQQMEKLKRGERIGLEKKKLAYKKNNTESKNIYKSQRSKFDKSKNEFKSKKHKYNSSPMKKLEKQVKNDIGTTTEVDDSIQQCNRGVKPFKGMKAFLESIGEVSQLEEVQVGVAESDNFDISDEEDWNAPVAEVKNEPLCNSLGSIMNMYISSDEDIPTNDVSIPSVTDVNKTLSINQDKSVCPINSNEVVDSQNREISTRPFKRNHKRKSGKVNNKDWKKISCSKPKFHKKRRATLLEKLLEPDIQHERNIILQCIRFIINENYFESDSKI